MHSTVYDFHLALPHYTAKCILQTFYYCVLHVILYNVRLENYIYDFTAKLNQCLITFLWVTFLAETSKDLEIILIIIVLSFTNRLSRTSLYL